MKVLFFGLGSIGQRHLRNILKMEPAITSPLEISAYRVRGRQVTLRDDLSVEEGVNLEEKYPIRTFTSIDDALAQKPDAVFITNPINMHLDTLKAVLEKTDADIFIEKPLTHTLDGISDLISLADKKGITAFVGFQMRFHPCIKKAKELLSSGAIGNVIAAHIEIGEYMPATRRYEDYRESTAVKKDLGGGIIIAQTHELDYACCLFGRPKSVYAIGGKLSHLEIDVEDTASLLLRFEQSRTIIPGETQFPLSIHMDFLQRPTSRHCKIIGTHGKIEFDLVNPALTCYNASGEKIVDDVYSDFQRNDMFVEELETFFAISRGETKPMLDMREGLVSSEIAIAAKKSIDSGEVVVL